MQQSYHPANADILVNIDGELLHRDQAKVSVFDSLVQGGDGCWEGLRVYDGRIFRLDQHPERLLHPIRRLATNSCPVNLGTPLRSSRCRSWRQCRVGSRRSSLAT